jgi:hypothetical protein
MHTAPGPDGVSEARLPDRRRKAMGKGGIRNCLGKLNDPGKLALRRLGILPQQLTTSSLIPTSFLC